MAITMIGTVTLKSFDARPLGQTGKGIQVEGTVTLQIPFSAQLQTLPFKVTEYSEKQAEFMRKYFFNEEGKQGLAKGNLSFDETVGWYFLIKELEFTSFKDAGAVSSGTTNYKKAETIQQTQTQEKTSLLNKQFTNAASAEEKLSNNTEGSENQSSAPKPSFGSSTYWQNIKKQ